MSKRTPEEGLAVYHEKANRMLDAVRLKNTGPVPVMMHTMLWYATYGGVTKRELMYDYDTLGRLCMQAMEEFEPDAFLPPHVVAALGPVMERTRFKQLQWPGHGVSDNSSYQYLDAEYMKASEYDDFIFDPTGYYLSTYLPRVMGAYEGLAQLAPLPAYSYFSLLFHAAQWNSPGVLKSLDELRSAGEESQRMQQHLGSFVGQAVQAGYVPGAGSIAYVPFDQLGDYMRGAKGVLTDMRRYPDKLLTAVEKLTVFQSRQAVVAGKASGSPYVFIPIHWGCDGFMSNEQFKKFWWPGLRHMIMELIANDLIPIVLWEANCSSRLEIIADIPAGKAVYYFESTPLKKAYEVLGGHICLRGNIPSSLFATGTPEQVDAYCRDLIETVGKGGGFMLDGSFGIPDEAPLENVRAMFESVRKYSA